MKLSNSRLDNFRKCPRSSFYKDICKIEPITEGEIEHDRSFGRAIHKGIEALYKGHSIDGAKIEFDKEYPEQLDLSDLEKTKDNGKLLIEAYWKKYSPLMKDWKVLSVETLDEYEPVSGVVFRVKLDLIMENLKYGGIYGFDWKTTSKKLDYRFWAQFNPSDQISTYFDYISKKYSQCSGFYIDAMSFGFRQRKYKGEPAGFHINLDRQLFTQTIDQLNDWRDSQARWAKLYHDAIRENEFPKNTTNCQYCSYRQICAAGWSWVNDKDLILCQYEQRSTNEQTKENDNADSAGVSKR